VTEQDLIERVARAIAHQEDFFKVSKLPTVSQRCNNPGNLTHWKDAAGQPYPDANGYVQFPDVHAGWRALKAQCKINVLKRRLTWAEFFRGRPGAYRGFLQRGASDPLLYAGRVMTQVLGGVNEAVTIHTPIAALLDDGYARA